MCQDVPFLKYLGNMYIPNRGKNRKKVQVQLLLTSLVVKQKEWVLIWIYIYLNKNGDIWYIIRLIYLMWMWMCVHICIPQHMHGGNSTPCGGQFSPSTTWVPRMEFRLSDLVIGSFTRWVISSTRTLINIFGKENGKSLLDRLLLLGGKQWQ